MGADFFRRSFLSTLRSLGRRFAENREIGRAVVTVVLLMATAGCSSTIEAGRIGDGTRPDPVLLDTTLTFGVSTRADVKDALGEPNGPGGIFLPIDDKPREAWAYNYELSGVDQRRMTLKSIRTYLFVYFDNGVYDGYMWFSSVPSDKPHQ